MRAGIGAQPVLTEANRRALAQVRARAARDRARDLARISGILEAPDADPAALHRWQAFCAGGRAARFAALVVARHGTRPSRVDAATIGRAAASALREPASWRDWGGPAEVQQHLKDLWLILVAHGRP